MIWKGEGSNGSRKVRLQSTTLIGLARGARNRSLPRLFIVNDVPPFWQHKLDELLTLGEKEFRIMAKKTRKAVSNKPETTVAKSLPVVAGGAAEVGEQLEAKKKVVAAKSTEKPAKAQAKDQPKKASGSAAPKSEKKKGGKCPCGKTHERRSPYCSKACYERYDSHGSFARAAAKSEGSGKKESARA